MPLTAAFLIIGSSKIQSQPRLVVFIAVDQGMPELLEKAISNGCNISIFPIHEKWKDIGNNKDYYDTKKMNFNRKKIK